MSELSGRRGESGYTEAGAREREVVALLEQINQCQSRLNEWERGFYRQLSNRLLRSNLHGVISNKELFKLRDIRNKYAS